MYTKTSWFPGTVLMVAVMVTAPAHAALSDDSENATVSNYSPTAFKTACNTEMLQSAADRSSVKITVREVPNMSSGQPLPGGAKYYPETESLPAYCQVSGSFVTNPETGKTANFLATLPQSWNGKYLQYGCFGHCGFFALNDATSPLVTIIAQGKPGDSLRKGYASFGTDEGHIGPERGAWAVKGPGEVDQDAIDDFLYRATKTLASAGKQLTAAFYAELEDRPQQISRSYFTGCSGGGRDGMVAASYFPEEFDGIIVGSPYANMVGVNLHRSGVNLAQIRGGAEIPETLLSLVESAVMASCDKTDGVADGLIQNPAACDFLPERDLPRCADDKPGADCFTTPQIETLSAILTATTDEAGELIQPGMSVSELQVQAVTEDEAVDNEALRVLAFGNDPDFDLKSVITLGRGSSTTAEELAMQADPAATGGFRAIVDSADARTATSALIRGIGMIPENADKLIRENRKLLIWHNLSDQSLTPYMSYNYYKQLAQRHGGYEKLQENIRLFALPGTIHCSMGGVGPTSFDPLTAMENWVEKGEAPNGLIAGKYPDIENGGKDFSQPPTRTMPLCKFPEMAQYKGQGEINDAANWHCAAGDSRMLELGDSGKRAGVQ